MKPLLLFYLLVVYVLLQFSWWAYLLIDLNYEVFLNKADLLSALEGSVDTKAAQAQYENEFDKRCMMVAGEGVVFLTLLVFGIYKTRESFKKEFFLARQQKNFLLSITHEFKSPLAAVKLNLQTLQKRDLNKDQRKQVLDNAISETDRVNNLVENALIATRIESKNLEFQNVEFDYSDCVKSVIKSTKITSGKKVNIKADIEKELIINGDPLAITSLVNNLIENSIKYSPESAEIGIELKRTGKNAVLRVIDTGTGIPGSEKSKVFEKFYRIGNEETRSTKGTGLGLFIVKHVVDLHNGRIELFDNKPSGTIFEVTLPAII